MKIKPIKNTKDYNRALGRIEKLMDAEPGTDAGDELDVLATLVEKYEKENFEILPPDPVEAIKFRMDQMGIGQKEIGELIGANRASEILNRKRKMSLSIIKKLHRHLNIPTESLID